MPNETVSDETLMEAYVAGDERAFEVLFRRYARPMVRMLIERGACEDDAREVVQQGFLKLHLGRHRYQAGRPLRPWLLTIVFNVRRDDLRRARRWRETPLERDAVADEALRPLDPMVRAEDIRRVRDALARLDERKRTLMERHWFEELTYPQIAARDGVSPGAVKLRAFRVHAELRKELAAA